MDSIRMKGISAPHERISDKIRALHEAGYKRSEIATFLERRYQQVRNVIKDDERRAAGRASEAAAPPGTDNSSTSVSAIPVAPVQVRVGARGVVEIPLGLLKLIKIAEGDALFVLPQGDELLLASREAMVRRLKQALHGASPEMISVVDMLAGPPAR